MTFKSNTHKVSRSRLVEVIQACIKAGGENNGSLVDAAYCDILESIEFEGK